MGCSSSNSAPKMENAARRRLSVGHVDKTENEADSADNTEADRGLITELDKQTLADAIGGDGDRKFSIGSNTDTGKTSFANKSIQEFGSKPQTMKGLGFTCRKGLKPESPNQDSWTIIQSEDVHVYGVFDGHGQKGHDVSNFVKENLPKLIFRDQRFKTPADHEQMCKDAFKKMQSLVATADRMKKLSAQLSGTTATIAIHCIKEKTITFAHVADSTCCLARYTDASKSGLKAEAMTRDHKPDLKDERARIEKSGGRVVFDGYANHRIYAKNGRYPGLNMSRCLGDLLGHSDAGVSCEPEVKIYNIQDNDAVLMLCSDGVWEFIQPQEAAEIIKPFGAEQATKAADTLAKEAWDRWIKEEGGAVVDDITAVLIHLNQ